MIKAATGRIHFAHIRNLKFNTAIDDPVQDFQESAHLSSDGTFDMYKIVRTLYETGFDGIWNDMNEPVSFKGENLSLGEKQLLSFARILLRKPKIIVLILKNVIFKLPQRAKTKR